MTSRVATEKYMRYSCLSTDALSLFFNLNNEALTAVDQSVFLTMFFVFLPAFLATLVRFVDQVTSIAAASEKITTDKSATNAGCIICCKKLKSSHSMDLLVRKQNTLLVSLPYLKIKKNQAIHSGG